MKTMILRAFMALALGGAGLAAPGGEMATIHTLKGRTYQDCKVVQRDPEGVFIKHSKGTARLLFADLPESTRFELGYNAQEAAARQEARRMAREERLEQQRQNRQRNEELLHAARLAHIKHLARLLQQAVIWPQPSPFLGPVPAVGFAAPGFGIVPPPTPRFVGWDNVGIATLGSGSGGIYVPQSGGFLFTGLPQVHYSPTLGYYNPGAYTATGLPGLAAPNQPPVVPGVALPGRYSAPLPR